MYYLTPVREYSKPNMSCKSTTLFYICIIYVYIRKTCLSLARWWQPSNTLTCCHYSFIFTFSYPECWMCAERHTHTAVLVKRSSTWQSVGILMKWDHTLLKIDIQNPGFISVLALHPGSGRDWVIVNKSIQRKCFKQRNQEYLIYHIIITVWIKHFKASRCDFREKKNPPQEEINWSFLPVSVIYRCFILKHETLPLLLLSVPP